MGSLHAAVSAEHEGRPVEMAELSDCLEVSDALTDKLAAAVMNHRAWVLLCRFLDLMI